MKLLQIYSSANTKFSKTQLSKTVQLGRFLFRAPNIFGPLIPIKEITSLTNTIINSLKNELKDVDY